MQERNSRARLSGWKTPREGYSVLGVANRIHLKKDGSVAWNGKAVSDSTLAKYGHVVSELIPRAFTILQIDEGAECGRTRVVRNLIDQQAKCQESAGLCGEGADPWARVSDVPPFESFYPSNEAPKK